MTRLFMGMLMRCLSGLVVLKNRGLALTTEADETTTGPASLMLLDPDGNPVLIDQHVSKPQKK